MSLWISLFLCAFSSYGQELIGLYSTYDDSYREWKIVPAQDSLDLGTLELSWPYDDKWNRWEFRWEGHFGQIRNKWMNQAHEWELIDGSEVVSMKPVWNGDLTEWRITHDGKKYTFKSKYRNTADTWITESNDQYYFDIFAEYERDPRDWIIEDRLHSAPFAVKMAMIFITVRYTTPKR